MPDAYAVFVEGIPLSTTLGQIDAKLVKAARIAINETAQRGRTMAAAEIARQINVPASYLAPSSGRLVVGKQATSADLEANIQARTRPTSLARFLVGARKPGQRGAQVAVRPGLAKFLPNAFLLKLRSGTDGLNNVGLAVRTKGDAPSKAYKPLKIAPGLFLLYGPSIDQIFKGAGTSGRGVRDQISPDLQTYLLSEFNRLIGADLA